MWWPGLISCFISLLWWHYFFSPFSLLLLLFSLWPRSCQYSCQPFCQIPGTSSWLGHLIPSLAPARESCHSTVESVASWDACWQRALAYPALGQPQGLWIPGEVMNGCDKCLPWQMGKRWLTQERSAAAAALRGDFCTPDDDCICTCIDPPVSEASQAPASLGIFISNPPAVGTTRPLKESKWDPKEWATNLERHLIEKSGLEKLQAWTQGLPLMLGCSRRLQKTLTPLA